MSDWRKRLLWLLVPVVLIAADQWTKSLVRDNIERYDRIEVIDGFFRINHVQNKGAAFGLFADMEDNERTLLLYSLRGLAMLLVVIYSLRIKPGEWVSQLGLHMILAGALGNMIDSITIGWVTDFLEFYLGDWRWPAFNLADSCIVGGVGLLLIDTLFAGGRKSEEREASGGDESAVPEDAIEKEEGI